VTQGGATNYSVTISPTGGFSGQINLSVSGLPTGANGSFTPNPATTSATLSVTTGTSTPAGTYTLTITGVSGSLTHTTTVTLVVAPPGVSFDNKVSSGFHWGVTTVTTPAFLIGSGANRAAMIMVTMSTNNATNINASLGGVSGTFDPRHGFRDHHHDPHADLPGDQSTVWPANGHRFMGGQSERRCWRHYRQWSQSDHSVHERHVVASNSSPATTSVTITSNPGD